MANFSDIEWTEATWNPVAGCKIISPGCTNCYAMRMAARLEAMGKEKYRGTTRKSGERKIWTGKVNVDYNSLSLPLTWKKPLRIFVNSMSDLFQENVSQDFVREVWRTMEKAKWHTFQILTKRPDIMLEMLSNTDFPKLPNVWLGTSVENQEYVWRIDLLRKVPAFTRFISFEPLIGEINNVDMSGIHWAIVGGESGPHSREMKENWVRHLQESCLEQNVAFFFKQWGGKQKKKTGRLLNGRTWDEYPNIEFGSNLVAAE